MGMASNVGSLVLLALAGLGLGFCRPDAIAQRAIRGRDELRPLYAMPQDVAEGKHLTQKLWASCHGADGISVNAPVPDLAGQRPGYLYLALQLYRSRASEKSREPVM